jgi:hypothetical protein
MYIPCLSEAEVGSSRLVGHQSPANPPHDTYDLTPNLSAPLISDNYISIKYSIIQLINYLNKSPINRYRYKVRITTNQSSIVSPSPID